MALYIGVDFHPHQQTVSYAEIATGKIFQNSFSHNVELVRRFNEQFKAHAYRGYDFVLLHYFSGQRRFNFSVISNDQPIFTRRLRHGCFGGLNFAGSGSFSP